MITSTANQQVKHLLQLKKKSKLRSEENVFLVEGIRMFREVPKDRVKSVYISESLFNKMKHEWDLSGFHVEILSDTVFSHVSDTKSPQGIMCVVRCEETDMQEVLQIKTPHFLVLDNLQDPGNLGTIIRTAEAAGVDGVFMSSDCVDIYNPKTIRSTMGSIYRMPFFYVEDIKKLLFIFKEKNIITYAADLDGKNSYEKEDYCKGVAFLIGNEGNGLRREISEMADKKIRIPMAGKVESLNAAIAASVLMFEAGRQRREDSEK